MNIKIYRPFFIIFLLCCICGKMTAQLAPDIGNSYYQNAVDLYKKGQYVDAEAQFRKAAENCPANDNVTLSAIASYRALCAIQQMQPNTESIVEELERTHSSDPRINDVYFGMAKKFHNMENYEKAAEWFRKLDERELSYDDRLECMFLQGHTYFQLKDYNRAVSLFTRISGLPNNKFRIPATYYYAHIEYERENYASAMTGFQSIRKDDRFTIPASYYILQIFTHQGHYEEVITEGAELLSTASDTRYAEVARIVAEACHRIQRYDEMLNYFNLYKQTTDTLSRNDQFLEASIYYYLKKYPEALSHFAPLTQIKDSIGQVALYYAGDAALKTDNKTEAMKYFSAAHQLNYNSDITNDAWTNYVKLSIEVDNNSQPLKDYQKLYPGKDNHRLLAAGYAAEKQYGKALAELDASSILTEQDKSDIQRFSFAHGINQMDAHQYEPAIRSFNRAIEYGNYDPDVKALAGYWKAEALYHLDKYDEAQQQYNEFLQSTNAFKNEKEYRIAHYNIAYCLFNQKKYSDANTWFRKYVTLPNAIKDKEFVGSAYSRIADCYYIEKKYDVAIENYNRALGNDAPFIDYIMFQKGMAQGLNETKQDKKLETMSALSSQYPQSEFAPAAIFEIGRTHLRSNKFDQAAKTFTTITEDYKDSPYNQRALIELGLININLGNNKKAIECYKQAILDNPQTNEAKNALVGLKNVYLETNNLEEYFAFSESIASGDSEEEKEDARFLVAEKSYLAGECDATISNLSSFLQLYPQSKYAAQVNFYLGDCHFRAHDFQAAKTCFDRVTVLPKNTYTEPALAGLALSCQQLTLFEEAYAAYSQLYTTTNNIEHSLKAGLMKAKAEEKVGNDEEALRLFNELSKNNITTPEGAEAAYSAISILRKLKRIEEAINAIFEFSETNTPQQYWVARGFIALGDIYVEQQDFEQAKTTYNSLLKGYRIKDDEILDSVQKRLDAIK